MIMVNPMIMIITMIMMKILKFLRIIQQTISAISATTELQSIFVNFALDNELSDKIQCHRNSYRGFNKIYKVGFM